MKRAIAIFFFVAGIVWSKPGEKPGGDPLAPFEIHYDRLKARLNLTDDQDAAIRKIKEDFRIYREESLKVHREDHKVLRELLEAEEVDLVKVRAQIEKLSDMMTDMAMKGIETRLAIEKVLSHDQRLELRKIVQQHKREHPEDRK